MKTILSFVCLIAFSIGFYLLSFLLSIIVTYTLAVQFSNGVSIIGVPAGFMQAYRIMEIVNIFIIFPLILLLTVKSYQAVSAKFKLTKLSTAAVIIISALILSYNTTSDYVHTIAVGYRIDTAREEFDISVAIGSEDILKRTTTRGEYTFTDMVYQYTLLITNKTNRTYNVSIEVTPGKQGQNMLFNHTGTPVRTSIVPGENVIKGEYEVSRSFTNSIYPESGKIPINIRFYNFDVNLDKSITVSSSHPKWRDVFSN